MKRANFFSVFLLATIGFFAPNSFAPNSFAAAPTSAGFNKNRILEDSDFDYANTWQEQQIQNLFEGRSSFFADYIDPAVQKPASWIIAEVARNYKISSKVLLAKMQAETSSVWNGEMSRKTMERVLAHNGQNVGRGVDWFLNFGWTDKEVFTQYKGFMNQLDGAAKLLSKAFANPQNYQDLKGKKWAVGQGATVFDGMVLPENRATTALYIYTPWIKSNESLRNVWLMMFSGIGGNNANSKTISAHDYVAVGEGSRGSFHLRFRKDNTVWWGWEVPWEIMWYPKDNPPHAPCLELFLFLQNGQVCRCYVAGNGKEITHPLGQPIRIDSWHFDGEFFQKHQEAKLIRVDHAKLSGASAHKYPNPIEIWDRYEGQKVRKDGSKSKEIMEFKIIPGYAPTGWRRIVGCDGKCFAYTVFKWSPEGGKIKLFNELNGEKSVSEFEIKGDSLVDVKSKIVYEKKKE